MNRNIILYTLNNFYQNLKFGIREILFIALLYSLGMILPMQDINLYFQVSNILEDSRLEEGISRISVSDIGINRGFTSLVLELNKIKDIAFSLTEDVYIKYGEDFGKIKVASVSDNWNKQFRFKYRKNLQEQDTFYISTLYRNELFTIDKDKNLFIDGNQYNKFHTLPNYDYWDRIIIRSSSDLRPNLDSTWTELRVYTKSENIDLIIDHIENKLGKKSNIQVVDGSSLYSENKSSVLKMSLNMLKISLILLVFSLCNIYFLLQMRWNNKVENYKLKSILGAKKAYLALELFLESYLIGIIAIFLSWTVLIFLSNRFFFIKQIGYNHKTIIVFLLFHLFVCFSFTYYRMKELYGSRGGMYVEV